MVTVPILTSHRHDRVSPGKSKSEERMKQEQLSRHFEALGARVKFRKPDPPSLRTREPEPPSFTIDVARDRHGEYFDFALSDAAPEFKLLQAKPKDRHLLLLTSQGQRFLCGHDERHWFVAGIAQRVSSVRDAKQALMPEAIWDQVKRLPPAAVDNRRNAAFRRQGEWFFVRSPREIPAAMVLKNEPLQRTPESKPHICQELFREGGELVYIVGTDVLTEAEYKKKKEQDPRFERFGYRTMVRNPTVYVRGYMRHDDHATVNLEGWHQVFMNAEFTTNYVSFLD